MLIRLQRLVAEELRAISASMFVELSHYRASDVKFVVVNLAEAFLLGLFIGSEKVGPLPNYCKPSDNSTRHNYTKEYGR